MIELFCLDYIKEFIFAPNNENENMKKDDLSLKDKDEFLSYLLFIQLKEKKNNFKELLNEIISTVFNDDNKVKEAKKINLVEINVNDLFFILKSPGT